MPADAYDPILGLILQATGNNNNAWGTTFNNSYGSPAARAIAGKNTITSTGGTVDLSTVAPPTGLRADIDFIQLLNGALTADVTVLVPNVSKSWWFQNNTTGGFNVYVKTPTGTATQIPQGVGRLVMGDGNNNLTRNDKDEIGSFRLSGKAAIGPGELACNGASYLKTTFPDLYTAIGTTWGSVDGTHFTMPNFTDTNRFLRSSSGSLAVGTYQANQNLAHTHTVTGAPGLGSLSTDSQGSHFHSAGIYDPQHNHVYNIPAIGPQKPNSGGTAPYDNMVSGGTTGTAATGVRVNSSNGLDTTYTAGAHSHNVTGAPSVGTLGTASSGGSEARPEAAVVLMGIRY